MKQRYSSNQVQAASHSHFDALALRLIINLYLEVYELANIKSAKKRILVNETKAARNKKIKSKVKTMIKKVDAAVAAGDKELAKTSLVEAASEIDKACSKGVFHKNTAARRVSRLSKAVNKIA
jgi:small subunit ribosomal protein S20